MAKNIIITDADKRNNFIIISFEYLRIAKPMTETTKKQLNDPIIRQSAIKATDNILKLALI